jgi:hypothetical protein
MGNRTALMLAVDEIVEQLKAEQRVLDTDLLAGHLAITYSDCGMDRDEIVHELERYAVLKGVPILSGNKAA